MDKEKCCNDLTNTLKKNNLQFFKKVNNKITDPRGQNTVHQIISLNYEVFNMNCKMSVYNSF